jgi:hypothetical protein
MKKPELTDMAWLAPKNAMDRASHRFGKCSECRELTPDDLRQIDSATSKIPVQGARYPENSQNLVNR